MIIHTSSPFHPFIASPNTDKITLRHQNNHLRENMPFLTFSLWVSFCSSLNSIVLVQRLQRSTSFILSDANKRRYRSILHLSVSVYVWLQRAYLFSLDDESYTAGCPSAQRNETSSKLNVFPSVPFQNVEKSSLIPRIALPVRWDHIFLANALTYRPRAVGLTMFKANIVDKWRYIATNSAADPRLIQRGALLMC